METILIYNLNQALKNKNFICMKNIFKLIIKNKIKHIYFYFNDRDKLSGFQINRIQIKNIISTIKKNNICFFYTKNGYNINYK